MRNKWQNRWQIQRMYFFNVRGFSNIKNYIRKRVSHSCCVINVARPLARFSPSWAASDRDTHVFVSASWRGFFSREENSIRAEDRAKQ